MILGALMVLATWVVAASAIGLLGLWPATIGATDRRDALRRALWWGLALAVIVVLALSLIGPLGSGWGLIALLGLVIVGGLAGAGRWRRLPSSPSSGRAGPIRWWVYAGLALAVVYLAFAALGPATNYDTGLYHLGALRYQQEFGLVPGIANLYFPLGYGNSVIPLAAFLGSTPWGEDGFRLLNGLLLTLLAIDTGLRIHRRRWTPGTFLVVAGLIFAWIPMVALSDYWVTSPTSDSSVLILTTVAVAYLADALWRPNSATRRWSDLAVALITSVVLVSMRPTMATFAAIVVVIAVALRVSARRQGQLPSGLLPLGLFIVGVGVVTAVLQVARDRILSGWFQYPLSVFAFDVPWQASDPVWNRTATLGAARDPQDLWAAAEGWQWIPGWIERAPTQWEFWLTLALLAASVVLMVIARRSHARLHRRALLVSMLPSAVAVLAWFVASPPYFRFVWGPLFTLVALPGAFAGAALTIQRPEATRGGTSGRWGAVSAAVALIAVTILSATTRFDSDSVTQARDLRLGPVTLPYAVAPVPIPPLNEATLESGLTVVSPTESDQCWAAYPTCTAQIEPTVALIGDSIAEGFRR